MNFAQILIIFCQILTIYVKNHKMHVKKNQERHFLKITTKKNNVKKHPEKNPTSKINQDLGYWGYWAGKIGVLGEGN